MYENLIRKTQTTAAVRKPILLELMDQINQGVQYLLLDNKEHIFWLEMKTAKSLKVIELDQDVNNYDSQ